MRGPQGTLLGEDNVSGSIRYITRDVDLHAVEFKAKAGASSTSDSDDLGNLVQAVLNVPLIEGRLGLRVSGHHRDIAGVMDIGPPRSEADVNDRKEDALRLKLGWQATEDLRVTLTGDYVDSIAGGPGLADFAYGNNSLTSNVFPNGGHDTTKIANLTLRYDLGWAEGISSTSYFDRDTLQREETHPITIVDVFVEPLITFLYRTDGVSPSYIPGLPVGDAIESGGGFWDNTTKRSVQELRLVSKHGGNWSWSTGLFYSNSDMTSGRPSGGPFGFEWFPNPGFEELVEKFYTFNPVGVSEWSRTTKSVYADITYAFNDSWDLSVGARFARSEQVTVEGANLDEDSTSPRAVLTWRPRDGLMLYGAWSQGFRPGVHNAGVVRLTGDLQAWPQPVANKEAWIAHLGNFVNTDGDEVISYELGLKTTLWNHRVRLTTSVYHMEWLDQITSVGFAAPHTGAAFSFNANVGESHSTGIELEADILLTDRLRLSFGGSLNEAELDKITDFSAGLFTYAALQEGARLPNAPEYTANLTLAYDHPLNNGWNVDARLTSAWVDGVKQSLTGSAGVVPFSTPIENIGARIALASPDRSWRITLFGENMSNQVVEYQTNIVGKYYGRPRTIGLEVSYFTNP